VFQDRFSDTWFEPHEVSDGTILLLAFITLTHLENPPDILAIEHPEEGIHPYLCQQVMDMLRDMAHGKLGPKPVQVVVSTHSPVLLNFVKPEEVRFCSRDLETGNTLIREAPKDHAEWKATFQEYGDQMGEMWLAGSLGGVPGSSAAQ
jgi:predicted ATPase